MNHPVVSVIILCYNQQDYIAQCIESVLNQDCAFDYEIILGDDASQDATPSICRDYASRYPDKIVLQLNSVNKGLLRNYYDCLQMSRGRYIADCGGDDFWIDTHKLQREYDLLERYPMLSVVYSNWTSYLQADQVFHPNNQRDTQDIFHPDDYGPATVARFLNRRFQPDVVLSAACYRKTIIMEAYRQFPDLFLSADYVAEDIPVTAFLLQSGPAYYLASEHLAYRVLPESISHSRDRSKYYRFAVACFCQTIDIACAMQLPAEALRDYCQRHYADYLHYAFLHRDRALADKLHQRMQVLGLRPSWKHRLKYSLLRWATNFQRHD